jgi:regulatory protein YycI of two-component signal transduction system YycFG
MNNSKITIPLIVVLLLGNIFFAWSFVNYRTQNKNLQNEITNQQKNNEIMSFTKLFISKVLNGTGEVSFEDRLQLENMTKNINDKDIIDSWQSFTKSKTPADVEKNFYSLLQILLNKITI